MKVLGIIIALIGLYQILALIISSIPTPLEGIIGWIVGIVVLVVGILLARK